MGTFNWETVKTQINVSLGARRPALTSFSTALFIDTLTNSSLDGFDGEVSVGNNGSKFVKIESLSEATDANTASAGSVGAQLLEDITGVFNATAQNFDAVGILAVHASDTWADILAELDFTYSDYYAVLPVSRAPQDIGEIGEAVTGLISTSRPRIVVAHSNSSIVADSRFDWADKGADPDALGGYDETTKDRIHLSYHPKSSPVAEPVQASTAARFLAWNLDTQCPPWEGTLPAVEAMSPLTTMQQSTLATRYVNYPKPFGTTSVYSYPGVNLNNRDMYAIVTRDWFEDRLSARIQFLQQSYSDRGAKLPLDSRGQEDVLGEIEAQYQEGVTAGHFLSRAEAEAQGITVRIEALPITNPDRAAKRLQFRAQIPLLLQTKIVVIDVLITE